MSSRGKIILNLQGEGRAFWKEQCDICLTHRLTLQTLPESPSHWTSSLWLPFLVYLRHLHYTYWSGALVYGMKMTQVLAGPLEEINCRLALRAESIFLHTCSLGSTSNRDSINVHRIEMEQNNVQLVTPEKSSAHTGSWLPPRDIHFILFLPCSGTQMGYSMKNSVLGPWGAPLDLLGTFIYVSMKGEW